MAHKKSRQTKSLTSLKSTEPELTPAGQAKYVRVCEFFEKILRHSKGQAAGKNFLLLPWQKRVLRGLFGELNADETRKHRVGYIELPKKQGKALALDTPIPTPAGWKCQGDLEVGDEVFAADGQRCFVVGKTPPMHGRSCYRVTFSDGESIIADENHLWYTEAYRTGLPNTGLGAKSTWEQRHIVSTSQIRDTLTFMASRKSVACNHRVPLAGPLDCEVSDLPIHPYVLGCWLGDGHSAGARITCAYKDIELIENLRSCGVTVVENKSSNENSGLFAIDSCHKDGPSHGCHSQLRLLGVLNNKHIPEKYLRSSRQQRLALLQGLMDTDGTASFTGKARVTRCEFGTNKPALRDGFVELVRSLGYKPTVCTTMASIGGRPCGEFFRVAFTGFRDFPPFRLTRKLNRLKWMPGRRPRSQYRQIVSVEPVPSVAVCCIQVTAPNGLYLAGKGMIPTHNSTTLAGIALYMTMFDSEPGAEVYGAACDREQAGIIYREAAAMVRASPALSQHLEVIDSRKTIIHKASNSFYRVLSADAFRAEGLNIHALLFDELHAQRDRRLWDALRYGGAARRQPLLLSITTAGYDRRSICWEQHQYAEKCIADKKFDPAFYGCIYAAPQECGVDGTWKNEETWKAANPSLGETITLDSFKADAREAEQSPTKLNAFLRYRLNVWTTQDTRWISPAAWGACATPLRPFGDRPVYAGLDLASTYDLSALVLVCPDPSDNSIDVLPFFWIPEANAVERAQRDKVDYLGWIRDGHVRVTDGNVTDYTVLHADITQICQQYNVRGLAVDMKFNAQMLANMLQGDGLTVAGWSQGGPGMSAPAKTLENLMLHGRLRHAGHPVLTWNAGNAAVNEDRHGNIFPSKAQSTERIDGIVALCQGIGLWMRNEQSPASTPEIFFI